MADLVAAAAAVEHPAGLAARGGGGGGDEPVAVGGADSGWGFPLFVGHRRRLAPDDGLFEAGNIEREQLARQAAVEVARDEQRKLAREAELAGDAELANRLAARYECRQCHAALPTARLLDIHISEMHDSFFAAQAARRMPVYLCLVEGCPRKFCTLEERKQHLTDHHKFPRSFHFDRMHLRRRKAQIRPLPQFQKGGHGRQAMAMGVAAAGGGCAAEGSPGGAAAAAAAAAAAGGEAALAPGQQGQQEGRQERDLPHADDDVVSGMSRLTMAAETSWVPDVVSFGRGRGHGLVGRSRRGRGGGGEKPAPRS